MSSPVYYNTDTKFYDPVKVMTPIEFIQCLQRLNMDEYRAAERLDLSVRQIQHYKAGWRSGPGGRNVTVNVPASVALLLRTMVRYSISARNLS